MAEPVVAPKAVSAPESVTETPPLRSSLRTVALPPVPPDEAPPLQIAGFKVVAELGRGSWGAVYKAWQASQRRVVALKVLRAGVPADDKGLARLRAQVQAVARLQHPQIVEVYGVGEHDGQVYLAQEYVDGGSLADQLDGTPQTAQEAVRLVQLLALTVHFAHQQGLVHGALKPANVLLQITDGNSPCTSEQSAIGNLPPAIPKITDFGVAHCAAGAEETQAGRAPASAAYLAPEQAAGNGTVGPAADVYSLGAILYVLLTGRPPFVAPNPQEALQQVLHDEPLPPTRLQPRLARDLEQVCLQCLQKQRRRRYGSALALANDLRRFLDGQPVRARCASRLAGPLKWARRRPAEAALWAVCALAPLLLLVAGWCANVTLRAERDEALAVQAGAARDRDQARQARQAAQQRDQEARQARTAASQARLEEKKARESAEQQAAVVARRYLLARDAIDRLVRAPAQLPQPGPLQRQLQEDALAFYQGQVKAQGPDAARSYRRAGDLLVDLGQPARADDAYRQALALQQKRVERVAAEDDRAELVLCYKQLGTLLSTQKKLPEGATLLRQALVLQEQLVRAAPANARHRETQAGLCWNLGMALQTEAKPRDAEGFFRQAADLSRQLAQEEPQQPAHVFNQAASLSQLGLLLLRLPGRNEEADAALRACLALRRQQCAVAPQSPACRSELGAALNNLAMAVRARSTWAEARTLLDEAVRHQRAALKIVPKHPQYRLFLRNHLLGLAETLVQLRDHRAAAAAAEEVPRALPGGRFEPVLAARLLAQCVPLAEADAQLEESARRRQAKDYGGRAVALLQDALARGFNAAQLADDPALASLRSRPDFLALVQGRQGAAKD
jgi:tetratricopeptide (TPR) repeat protein